MRITRRTLLSVGLIALAAGSARLLFTYTGPDDRIRKSVIDLSGRFQDLGSLRRMGERILPQLAQPSDAKALLELINPDRGMDALHLAIADEHRRGEILLLDGWPLSMTEARIFALVALAQDVEAIPGDA